MSTSTLIKPDKQAIQSAARGKWSHILTQLAGIPPDRLDGRNWPCPHCDGTDRFNADRKSFEETGTVYCNQQCGISGDGFRVLMTLNNWAFPEALEAVANYLNLEQAQPLPAMKPQTKAAAQGTSFPAAVESLRSGVFRRLPSSVSIPDEPIRYRYNDADGSPVGVVLRWDRSDGEKEIRQLSTNGNGWQCSWTSKTKPLWKLADIREAETVFICEGEKCAEAIESFGLVATTSAGGSGAPAKSDWTVLDGKRVVIVPDHDEPGRKYLDKVAELITRQAPAATIEVADLSECWPEIPEAGDAFDWSEAHDSKPPEWFREELERITKPIRIPDDKTDITQTDGVLSVLSSDFEDWPEPTAIAGPEPEPMKADDFPGFVGEMVKAVAENSETPVELPGLVALGVIATGCQQRFEIACDGQHTEPTNLWVCPALESGNRKTAVLNTMSQPVRMFERSQRAEKAEDYRQAESLRLTLQKRIESLRTKAAKASDSQEMADIQREIEAVEREVPPVEFLPTLTADDCTPEHVATLLSRHGERLTLLSDEAGIFDLMAGRYSRGVANLDVYLQGHAGGPVRVDRGSRDSIDLEKPCLTVCVSPQPSVLEDIGKRKDFAGRGLLARFMFAVPKSRLGFRSHRPKPIPENVSQRWAGVVQRMLAIEQKENGFGKPEPETLYLSPEAYRLWKAEQLANEHDMRPGNTWSSQTAWASKYPGAVLRIAGVLHVALSVDQSLNPAATDVPGETMETAIRLGQKIKAQTLKTFGVMALSEDQRFARKILEWVQRENVKQFTGREAAIHCNSAGSSKELEGAFSLLAERGWIRQGEKQQPEGGGRPSHPWQIHPEITKFTDITDKTNPEGVSSVLSSTFENNRAIRPESNGNESGIDGGWLNDAF